MAWTSRIPALVALALVGAAPLTARAITVNCSDDVGTCEVSNDGFDSMSCTCADGQAGGGGGGNEWAGLNEAQLLAECHATLQLLCGPPLPPDGISCETREGTCTVDNDPFDSFSCECADGGGGGGAGGNAWAGLDDDQLYAACLEIAADFCADGPDPTMGTTDSGDPTDPEPGTSDTGDDEGGSSGGSDDGEPATGTDSGGDGDSSGGTGSSGDAGSSDDGPGESTGDDGPGAGDASMSAGDASASAGDASASAGDASASAGSDDTGGDPAQDSTSSGCGCSTEDDRGGPLALAIGLLLGLLGRRPRRR